MQRVGEIEGMHNDSKYRFCFARPSSTNNGFHSCTSSPTCTLISTFCGAIRRCPRCAPTLPLGVKGLRLFLTKSTSCRRPITTLQQKRGLILKSQRCMASLTAKDVCGDHSVPVDRDIVICYTDISAAADYMIALSSTIPLRSKAGSSLQVIDSW